MDFKIYSGEFKMIEEFLLGDFKYYLLSAIGITISSKFFLFFSKEAQGGNK